MSVQVEAIRVKNVAKGEVEKFRVVAVVPRENRNPQKVGGGSSVVCVCACGKSSGVVGESGSGESGSGGVKVVVVVMVRVMMRVVVVGVHR